MDMHGKRESSGPEPSLLRRKTERGMEKGTTSSTSTSITTVTSIYSYSAPINSTGLEWRSPILENVMEALADPNTHLIGVYGFDDKIKDTLLQRVYRIIQRDNLFDLVLTTTVTRKRVTRRLDMKRIQKEMAQQLGLNFDDKSKDKRAQALIGRIKIVQKILIVIRNLHKGLDLGKVGIPYGSDHPGCKILLTSTTEDVLSNHMHTQKNFSII